MGLRRWDSEPVGPGGGTGEPVGLGGGTVSQWDQEVGQ